jgi:hypothetical protein
MIQRERDAEQEKADLINRLRQMNPHIHKAYVVAIEPYDQRFQKWYVAAYATREQALARAYEEYQSFAGCPSYWVDATVEEISLEPTYAEEAIPIVLPLPHAIVAAAA